MTDFATIEGLLRALGRRVRRAAMLDSALWCGAGLLFAVGLAVLLAEVGWVRTGLVVLAAAALVGAAVWVWLLRRRAAGMGRRFELVTPRLAEGLAPELGTAPTAAVDLARRMADPPESGEGFSHDLAAEHIARTAAALRGVDFDQRFGAHHAPKRRWALGALGVGALWAVALVFWLGTGRSRLATLIVNPGAARMSDVPLAGDIDITYHYPAYTGLTDRVVQGGDGSISAVVGTEVQLQAVADGETDSASLLLANADGTGRREIPLHVSDGRTLAGSLSVLHDGRYRFALVQKGDRIEERQTHPVRAVLDAYPKAYLDQPAGDVELKDDQDLDILWRATDDYGVSKVTLVVEPGGDKDAIRIPLVTDGKAKKRLEGRYHWAVSQLQLDPGKTASFYIEAVDNDAISGPKKATSAARKLSLFSARRNHEKILARQRDFLNHLVDWLGAEIETPFSPQASGAALKRALDGQEQLVQQSMAAASTLSKLLADMHDDKLGNPAVGVAFQNISAHVTRAIDTRKRALAGVRIRRSGARIQLASAQHATTSQLERDIIYLDDLLAIQRIDELKDTAKRLLTAQHDLQDLLAKYRKTQDPALRATLEKRIRELRQQMMDLLAKMAQIKEHLPGEYRNMESATMLQLDDQLGRLEKMLRQGNLDKAAAQLEQLANMIENMVDSINNAEKKYGGKRYDKIRKQLAQFAQQFQQLESQQKTLAKRAESLAAEYRKKAIEQAGKNLDAFVKKARQKTEEALRKLDTVARTPDLYDNLQRELQMSRQRLLDLDQLLQHRDFAEARDVASDALQHSQELASLLKNMAAWQHKPDHELGTARDAAQDAAQRTHEVRDMLDKLFPNPSKVLRRDQLAQMQRMTSKQQSLEQKAQQLGQKMDALSKQLPLFGGQPRANLNAAENEMGQAVQSMKAGQLPGAAAHKRRAAEQLEKLRAALEKASQGGGGSGLPLPLGGSYAQQQGAGASGSNDEDVQIPQSDSKPGPRFRKELMEAAKQKAPKNFEEAVRKYYEELIH